MGAATPRNDPAEDKPPSMVRGQLRVAVIGAQTAQAGTPAAHTVYRTAVNYRGRCFHRLIRYRDFLGFARKVKMSRGEAIAVSFPPKMWSRKASLRADVVEARQVLLNEYMQAACVAELTPRVEERLLRLVQVGKYENSAASPTRARLSKASQRPTLEVDQAEEEQAKASEEHSNEEEQAEVDPAAASSSSLQPQSQQSSSVDEEAEDAQPGGERAAETQPLRFARAPAPPPVVVTPIKRERAPEPLGEPQLPTSPLKRARVEFEAPEDAEDEWASSDSRPELDSNSSSASLALSPADKFRSQVSEQNARISQLLGVGGVAVAGGGQAARQGKK